MISLEGKTAVVTGAAGTMGLAETRFLLEGGARVVTVDLSEARLREVAHSLHGEIMFVEADICVAVTSAHARAVLPTMKARKWGRIINVSSLAAKTGWLTSGTAYSVSKGAMSALTFSLARESAAFGVTVNAISPAYVRTPIVTEGLSEAQCEALLATILVGRFCEPDEFAHVVRFLASPLAGFITGEVVDINGGLLME